jgi:hypothetical protein
MKEFILLLLCLAAVGCGLDQKTYRADKPISREQASKDLDMPLPVSATNVYYVVHAGGLQEFQSFIRFTVGPGDESNAVEQIIADHSKRMPEYDSYPAVSLSNMMSQADRDLSPMPWWNLDSVTNGYSRRSTIGQPFYIWADLSQHTIYLHASD